MGNMTRKSQLKYKKEVNSVLPCIFCRNNLCCRLWQDGREACNAFVMALF